MKEEPLVITFNYHVEEYNKTPHPEAIAGNAASKSYFRIHSFRLHANGTGTKETNNTGILPKEIMHTEKKTKKLWMHRGSEKEPDLNNIIGKAIEEKQNLRLPKTI